MPPKKNIALYATSILISNTMLGAEPTSLISKDSLFLKTEQGILKAFCNEKSLLLKCSEISLETCKTEVPLLVQECVKSIQSPVPSKMPEDIANKWAREIMSCFGKKLGKKFPVNNKIPGCKNGNN